MPASTQAKLRAACILAEHGVGDGVSGQVQPPGSVDGMGVGTHRGVLSRLRVWDMEEAKAVGVGAGLGLARERDARAHRAEPSRSGTSSG